MNKILKCSLIGGFIVLFIILTTLLFIGGNNEQPEYTENRYKEDVKRMIDDLMTKSEEQIDQINTALLLNEKTLAETSASSLSMYPRFVIDDMSKKKIPESIRAEHNALMEALSEMESSCTQLTESYKSGDLQADSTPCTITALDKVKAAYDAIVN